jgi:thymidylate synthase
MRIFNRFPEAFTEITRDLAEMGTRIETQTMQDRNIAGDPDFATIELTNYVYTVTDARFEDLRPVQPWADADWLERRSGIEGSPVNPGNAWTLRRSMWEPFLHDGQFSYTYSGQFDRCDQVKNVIQRLIEDRGSRQLYVAMWEPRHSRWLGYQRVPCSLGWHFMYRGDALNVTYFMRSCDFASHFQNDVFMSMKLQEYIANAAGVKRGHFAQFISSLHVYQKDIEGVF